MKFAVGAHTAVSEPLQRNNVKNNVSRWLAADGWQGTVLRTSAQFYKWYSDLSGLRRQATEAAHGAHLAALSDRLQLIQDVLNRATQSMAALDDLAAHHRSATAQVAFTFYVCNLCSCMARTATAFKARWHSSSLPRQQPHCQTLFKLQ